MGTAIRKRRLRRLEDNDSVSSTLVIPILGIQSNFLQQK